jgi:hypothetical protein
MGSHPSPPNLRGHGVGFEVDLVPPPLSRGSTTHQRGQSRYLEKLTARG